MAASKSPQLRLFHIRDEIEGVMAALRGLSFEQYSESFMLRRAAERALQIISEAAKTLPPELTARYPQAPWHAIVGIGNVLRHEYQTIDDKRLWDVRFPANRTLSRHRRTTESDPRRSLAAPKSRTAASP